MSYRVAFTDHTFDDLAIEREILDPIGVELVDGERADKPLSALVAGADAVMVMYEEIDEAVISELSNCRIISRTGIGLDNIDVDAATERGIYVTNVPDYCIAEVSDHTLALILAHERKVREYDAQVRDGGWDVAEGRAMRRLSEQTIGLLGFGNIARAVGEKAAAFGMDVVAYDEYLPDEEIRSEGATPVDGLDPLLERADVLSVHVPLTDETLGIVGEEELETLGPSAFVVNTARGGIVDESALAAALEDGVVAGAGIDVLESEPPADDHPLIGLPNAIVTPHTAWNSAESVRELRAKAAWNVRDALEGNVPEYLINDSLTPSP